MINVDILSNCCGCSACVQSCPQKCITMKECSDGFLYPSVDSSKCINCKLCEKVCPFNSDYQARKPLKIFAAKNKNREERLISSSGGIFVILSRYIISIGGVVFGARFSKDFKSVIHAEARNELELQCLLRSKYIQSNIGESFKKTKRYLEGGISVLFTGTPCQIQALHTFLKKSYRNLATLDVVCHGVPSPGCWKRYLEEEEKNLSVRSTADGKNSVLFSSLKSRPVLTGINFREKQNGGYGWKKSGFVVHGKTSSKDDKNTVLLSTINIENPYFMGFIQNLYLRDSCYSCPARSFKSQSDFTLGDLWGISKLNLPEYIDDDTGISLMCINTEKGLNILGSVSKEMEIWELSYDDAIISNDNLVSLPTRPYKEIGKFRKYYQDPNITFSRVIEESLHKNFLERTIIALQYKLHLK